jgi:putative DNA-invertase from lambdoid prophage Rac
MKYGYLRVSTKLQSFEQQESALRKLGVIAFEKETASGRALKRPLLQRILAELRAGDELHVFKLDRLGRTAIELLEIARELEMKEVSLVVNGEKYDPTTTMGKMFFGILATFAEFEAGLISDRTRERLAELREQGKMVGRQSKLSKRQEIAAYHAIVEGNKTVTGVAGKYKVSRTTIRNAVNKQKMVHELNSNPELRREMRLLDAETEGIDKELDAAYKNSDRDKKEEKMA